MPSPTNPADVPAVWLSSPTQDKPAAYTRAVARKVKNNRHRLVLDMATVAEDICRKHGVEADVMEGWSNRAWRELSVVARHPSRVVSPQTRAAVIEKVRADLAEPYRAKGRG